MNVLKSYLINGNLGGSSWDEFSLLVRNFRDILIPLLNAHLKAIFSSDTEMDTSRVIPALDAMLT